MKKQAFEKPHMTVQFFEPNTSISTCWKYKATLHCKYGATYDPITKTGGWGPDDGLQHGQPCANSYADISGATGHESGSKWSNPIFEISVPGVDNTKNVGDIIQNSSWVSYDGTNKYLHSGYATITSRVIEDPDHPGHS